MNWLVALVSIGILHFTHVQIIKQMRQEHLHQTVMFIPRKEVAKAMSLGYSRLLSDFYWLSFVQYYGGKESVRDRFNHAQALLALIISLDPKFKPPYWFASFVLAGDLKKYAESDRILQEGIKNNPDEWSIPYIAGFNQYLYMKDESRAAHYYRMASRVPGAPAWLEKLARVMEAKLPSRIKLASTWEQIYNSSEGAAKEKARLELQRIWSETYYDAPDDAYKKRALGVLEQLDVELMPQEELSTKH